MILSLQCACRPLKPLGVSVIQPQFQPCLMHYVEQMSNWEATSSPPSCGWAMRLSLHSSKEAPVVLPGCVGTVYAPSVKFPISGHYLYWYQPCLTPTIR